MKSVEVWEHPTLGVKEIKVGFSWPAFFFGFFWSLVKKLWRNAFIYFFILVALNVVALAFEVTQVGEYVSPVYLLTVCLGIGWGAYGNQWIRNYYVKRGFVPVGLKGSTINCPFCQQALAPFPHQHCPNCRNEVDQWTIDTYKKG